MISNAILFVSLRVRARAKSALSSSPTRLFILFSPWTPFSPLSTFLAPLGIHYLMKIYYLL